MKVAFGLFSVLSRPVFSDVLPEYVFQFLDSRSPDQNDVKQARKLNFNNYLPNEWDCDNIQSPVPDFVVLNYDLDTSFYSKYVHAYGIPILSSELVKDETLRRACYTVRFMLADREDIRRAQYFNGGRIVIMAEYPLEKTTDVPEHAFLKNDPNTDWDERARGLGGNLNLPISSAAEENVLCYPDDRYRTQDILVHEFAHGVHLVSAEDIHYNFQSRLQAAYDNAMKTGLWDNTYAATNYIEYFGIGVQCFFEDSREGPKGGDGIHNHIDTRTELAEYDPDLYDIIVEVFPCQNELIRRCDGTLVSDDTHIPMNCPYTTVEPTIPPNCENNHSSCNYWASIGECEANPGYMLDNCKKGCQVCNQPSTTPSTATTTAENQDCKNDNSDCEYWAGIGECDANQDYMLVSCKKSCNVCDLQTSSTPTTATTTTESTTTTKPIEVPDIIYHHESKNGQATRDKDGFGFLPGPYDLNSEGVTREAMCLKNFGHGWRPLSAGDDIEMAAKILDKAKDYGQYAFPDGPINSNSVGIMVDFCLSADKTGQATITACSPGYSSVRIACYNPDLNADHFNTAKSGGMFYCDLGAIGLMEKVGKKYKETKYNLKKCVQKRANGEKPKNILNKAKGQYQLDCVNCEDKNNVQWSAVECEIGCKKDKKGNQLKSKFRCEPVYDSTGTQVIGARSVYEHLRFQEICGGGCSMDPVADYMGSTTANVPAKKCGDKDCHNVQNFLPLSKCNFDCDLAKNVSTKKKTNKIMNCACKTENNARSCKWKIGNSDMTKKTGGGKFIQIVFRPGTCAA